MMSETEHFVIAIDGPAGAGKSTVAKEIARKLSLLYIDSGAMYRAVAWKTLNDNVSVEDEDGLATLAGNMKIELKPSNDGTRIFVDGTEITDRIRTPAVTDVSSRIAALASVRKILVRQQRMMGETSSVVMEGRDIGTVVFPDARFKFYLDATVKERAGRRKKDFEQAGYQVTMAQLERDVAARDERDKSRDVGPLRKAEDAVWIDTTNMSIEQVVDTICERVATEVRGRPTKDTV